MPKGVVVTTKPGPRTSIKPGDTIQLVVSMGPSSIVPDLVGIENLDIATQRLRRKPEVGNVTEQDDPNDTVPPGAVLSQNPPKGTEVEDLPSGHRDEEEAVIEGVEIAAGAWVLRNRETGRNTGVMLEIARRTAPWSIRAISRSSRTLSKSSSPI